MDCCSPLRSSKKMPSLWYSGDLGQEPFDWLVDIDEGRRRSADPVLVPVEVSILRQGSLSWGKDNYVNCNWRRSLSYFHQKFLSFCSFRRVTMSLCSMFLIWLLIYILMEWPSGKMLGESLHPKSIRNQSCQILFHVKCFQFASASHQDIRMFLTGERSVKIMSGASSNSAWTISRGVLWIEEVSCSLWRAEGQE